MNKILDSIASTLNFYDPYYKQFKLHLKGKHLAILERIPSKAYEYFTSEGYNTICIDKLDNLQMPANLDGIIINNYLCDNVEYLFTKIFESLNNDGIMLFIFNNQTYNKEIINFLSKEKFNLIEELIGDDKWNFILYSKKTTKL